MMTKLEDATQMGAEHGHAAGSWVFDGNSDPESIRTVLGWIADGDPQWEVSGPLSGEWAGDPTPRTVLEALEVDEDADEAPDLLDAYEEAFYMAHEDEVIRSGHAMLPDEEVTA